MTFDYRVVDVFTSTPFQGNPVAVVLGADGLSDEQMQRIAAWTNLSETTFHLQPTIPEADYRLRIFTPRSELPFAGHPTLGSAHALIEAGLVASDNGRVVQECKAGLVPITIEGDGEARMLRLQMPEATLTDLTDAEQDRLVAILGASLVAGTRAALVDVGARWIVAELESAESLLNLTPDLDASARFETELRATGVTLFASHRSNYSQIEVRSFAPSCGVSEDPVCGSGNGAVATYRVSQGQIAENARYIAMQGQCVGRSGHVVVASESGQIYVGGNAVTTVKGQIAAE